jgi:hypothetical protein
MNDIYANDPTPPISEKQKQELAASLDSAGSAVPLRPSDLHTRTMVPGIREQIAKWVPQGPAAAGRSRQAEVVALLTGMYAQLPAK